MDKRIITISREFGSGGRYIGEQVAKRLGISYYDKELIGRIAEESGLAKEFIEKVGEYAPSKSIFAYSFAGRSRAGVSVEDYLNSVQRKIILDIAEKEPCVIVGRCADYILRERTDCSNIFIHGNEKQKTERIVKLYDVSVIQAKKLMKEADKKRSLNYSFYTERNWGETKNYTMTLNSSELGIEKCIDLICSL